MSIASNCDCPSADCATCFTRKSYTAQKTTNIAYAHQESEKPKRHPILNKQPPIPPFTVFILRMKNQKMPISNILAMKYLNNPFAVARKSPT